MIGILLHTEDYKANTQRGIWLCDEGLHTTFQRLSSKEPTPTPPLFGTSELSFKTQKTQGEASFIDEWHAINPRTGLSRPYKRFSAAGYLAIFLRENAGILPDPEPMYVLSTKAYDALERADEPLIVIFKILYKTALMEGFPIKEDWLYRQNPEFIQLAASVLKNPINTPAIQATSSSLIIPLIKKLQLWLSHHTEFRLPQTSLVGA
ncbi:MAG: hypothetical protein ACPGN3_17335 [Opitutales bacterium]